MSDAQTSRPVPVRNIRVEVATTGPHELDVSATLVDERPAGNPNVGIDAPVLAQVGEGPGVGHLRVVVIPLAGVPARSAMA